MADELLRLWKLYRQTLNWDNKGSFGGFMEWVEKRYWSEQTLPPITIKGKTNE